MQMKKDTGKVIDMANEYANPRVDRRTLEKTQEMMANPITGEVPSGSIAAEAAMRFFLKEKGVDIAELKEKSKASA